MVFDLAIAGGRVYDGTGNPWMRADVAVEDGKICRVGKIEKGDVGRVIDASGFIVCPGFIDIHTHSEISLLANNRAESAVRQGVTLHLTGNCGSSAAPIVEEKRDLILESKLIGLIERSRVDWLSFGEYLDRLQENRVAINVASLVGQGTIRMGVMGYESGRPRREELKAMKRLLSESMEDGAFGMSVGLNTFPSGFADTDELVELCKVLKRYNGVYFSHMRGGGFIEDTVETIEIGERSNLPVHPAHHRPVIYRKLDGDIKDILNVMDDAREKGVDLTCDLYPYVESGGGLKGMLPPWVQQGGTEKILDRLSDPQTREKVKADMVRPGAAPHMGFIATAGIWDKVILLHHSKSRQFIGKTLSEIAAIMGVQPLDAVLNLILEEGKEVSGLPTVQQVITEEMLVDKFKHSSAMVGSDGSAWAPYGALGLKLVHPRAYGCYPRVLGRWVRDEKLLSMEEAIRKMTSFPAQVLGIQDRGLIRKGLCADITVFDPKTVVDKATFIKPHQYPEGIKYVLVNGQIVIDEGEHTGILAGRVLRKTSQ